MLKQVIPLLLLLIASIIVMLFSMTVIGLSINDIFGERVMLSTKHKGLYYLLNACIMLTGMCTFKLSYKKLFG